MREIVTSLNINNKRLKKEDGLIRIKGIILIKNIISIFANIFINLYIFNVSTFAQTATIPNTLISNNDENKITISIYEMARLISESGNLALLSFDIVDDNFISTSISFTKLIINEIDLIGNIKNGMIYNSVSNINFEKENMTSDFIFYQHYPNPINPTTTIKFYIKKSPFFTLKIYDITGREKIIIVDKNYASGNHCIPYNLSSFISEIYFYHI